MSFEQTDELNSEDNKSKQPDNVVSRQTGGLVADDTPIPKYENQRFISSAEYYEKYHYFLPDMFTVRDIAPACRKWHENPELPEDQRIGLISEKRLVAEVSSISKIGNPSFYKERKRWQWFVFDIKPQDHPGWTAYHALLIAAAKRRGSYINKHFAEYAPIYLERFDAARANLDATKFRIGELEKMIGVEDRIIRSWVELGVEGYGKLPIIKASEAIKPLMENGEYTSGRVRPGRIDYYFDTKDIRRFLKGELADPTKKFKDIDDAVTHTTINEIAAESGYFVWRPDKVYPATYDGFIDWAKKNIVFYDRMTRKKTPFKPNPKQLEVYRNAFAVDKIGLFKHRIIGICRPRGDYKTFDVTLLLLFRFFNMFQERIYLVTNSVQQTSHIIYREAIQLIKNSPTLSAMLDTQALDIQKDGIYLRSGKGVENVFSSIEIVPAEGGARSNATCIAWSEAWKFRGDSVNVAELEQSIRGVDNAWFLVESTVSPKGHFFYNYYKDSLTGENPILYFQYYDGSQRQNHRIDENYINHVKRNWPLHYKMFFDNKWEDAVVGLFSEERIFEMGFLGINGGFGRNSEMLYTIEEIVRIGNEIKKLESGIDVTKLKLQQNELIRKLTPVSRIYTQATESTLMQLGEIYGCEFVVGLGIDRAKQMQDRSDRTVIAVVARGILDPAKWGSDRIFFLLDLNVLADPSFDVIMEYIRTMADKFGGFVYVDIEDYNAVDIYKTCEKLYGKECAYIAPVSLKHQTLIFDELRIASENGMLKIPEIDIWVDSNNTVHYSKPLNKPDILREELSVFEAYMGTSQKGRGSDGWFGAAGKRRTGRTNIGEPKDDCVYALAHACHAAIRGDIAASALAPLLMDIYENKDIVGVYS